MHTHEDRLARLLLNNDFIMYVMHRSKSYPTERWLNITPMYVKLITIAMNFKMTVLKIYRRCVSNHWYIGFIFDKW